LRPHLDATIKAVPCGFRQYGKIPGEIMRRAGDHTRPRGGPRACGTLCTWWACFVDYGGADARGFDAPGLLSDTGETVTDALRGQVAIFDMDGVLVDSEPH